MKNILDLNFGIICYYKLYKYMYRIAQNGGGGKLWQIWQIRSHSPKFYPYHKTAGINSSTNEYRAISEEHAWLKLVATKCTWTLFNPRYSPIAIVYASSCWITNFSFTKKLCSVIMSIIFMSSQVLSPHYKCPHHFIVTRDDKVNDCGFKFSVACDWHVLFKEDKDDSLQFAKVFPATVLCYTVL